jgi:hypothetical protein
MPDMELVTRERLQRIERFLWAAVLVALPVTSFRYLPFMRADTQVRPLSLIPAVLLLLALVLRCVRERRLILWSRYFQPLLIFILVAVASSAVGFLFAPVNLYSYTYSGRVLRAWLSLGVGLVFLITSMCMNRDEQDLRFTIKWVYVGLIAEVAWSLVQFFEIYIIHFGLLDVIQKTVMMAGLPPNGRISGLALEPSWLAAQVITIYLPWAFAAMVKNYNWGGHRFSSLRLPFDLYFFSWRDPNCYRNDYLNLFHRRLGPNSASLEMVCLPLAIEKFFTEQVAGCWPEDYGYSSSSGWFGRWDIYFVSESIFRPDMAIKTKHPGKLLCGYLCRASSGLRLGRMDHL